VISSDPVASVQADVPGPFDVLVVGSGVAGLSAAVRLAGRGAFGSKLSVGVLSKGDLSQSATRWAQGGVAAVLGGDEDSTDLHLSDTLAAGAGLCDEEAVRVLVDEGPGRVHELIALGAEFDRAISLWPARVVTPGPGSSTPGGRPPGPRWSARWSTPPARA
jgi:L-aspartate oxidase